MNSPFANIYFALMQKLLTLTAGSPPAPVIAYIDMDYGQLEMNPRPNVAFPCVLIDFKGWKFDDLGNLNQKAGGMICLKFATDPYDETSSITPGTYSQAALQILELEWQIYKLIQGWAPPVAYDGATPPNITQPAQPMIRTTYETDNRRPGLKVRELVFKNGFTDFSAQRPSQTTPATLNPTIDVTFPT